MKPPPTPSATWSDELRALHAHDMREIWDRRIAPHIWNQYHNQLDLYLRLAGDEPLDILDVGCAQGTLALLLAERGHRVTAVDIRQEFLDYAKTRHTHGDVRFLRANAVEEEVPGRYDLIFANQILEHLVYPEVLLSRLHAQLRPGGRLIATTPNGDYLKCRLPSFSQLGDRAQWEHLQFTADGDGHFFAYTATELREVLRQARLDDVQVRYFESPMISGHMRVRHAHRITPAPLLRLLDTATLALPFACRRLAHQLLAVGSVPQ